MEHPNQRSGADEAVRQNLIRVLLVDESPVVRLGLRRVLAETRCYVVGDAGTAAEGLAEARRRQPDVVIMDLRLPDSSGADLCRTLRGERSATQVVIFTELVGEAALLEAIQSGANAYLLKGTAPERIVEAIERAVVGQSLLDPASARAMIGWVRRRASGAADDDPMSALSHQERRILPLIARGLTNREIGEALILSDQTVKGYVSTLLKKLGLSRRTEVAALVARDLPHVAAAA